MPTSGIPAQPVRARTTLVAFAFVSVSLLSLSGGLVWSQQGQEPFVDRLDVRETMVDLFVEDRNGNPILDLDPSEVRIFEDGIAVDINSFVRPGAPGTANAVGRDQDSSSQPTDTSPAPEAEGRSIAIFIDEIHLHPFHRKKVLTEARKSMRKGLEDGDRVLIARFDGGIRVVQPWTTDHREVLAALDREAKVERIAMRTAFLETERALRYMAQQQFDNTSDKGSRTRFGKDGDVCVQNGQLARDHAQQVHSMAVSSLSGLSTMVSSLATSSGRKDLIYVSDGVPMTPGTEVYNFAAELCNGTGAASGLQGAVDTSLFGSALNTRWDPKLAETELAEFGMHREWEQIGALANSKEVSIYPLEARGLETARLSDVDSTRVSMRTETAGRSDRRDSQTMVADLTGGKALFDTNDFERAFSTVLDYADSFYRLSYTPPTPGDKKQHKIRVEVDRPGANIRYRKSYFSQTAEDQLADRLIGVLLHGGQENPLGVQLATVQTADENSRHNLVKVGIKIPFESLTTLPSADNGSARTGQFTVLVAGQEEDGRTTAVGTKEFPVLLDGSEPKDGFVYEVELRFRSSQPSVAIGVRDDVGGEVSFLRRTVEGTS